MVLRSTSGTNVNVVCFVTCPNDVTEAVLPVNVYKSDPIPEHRNVDGVQSAASHTCVSILEFAKQGDPLSDAFVLGRSVDHPFVPVLGHNRQVSIGVLWSVVGTRIGTFVVGIVGRKPFIEH